MDYHGLRVYYAVKEAVQVPGPPADGQFRPARIAEPEIFEVPEFTPAPRPTAAPRRKAPARGGFRVGPPGFEPGTDGL